MIMFKDVYLDANLFFKVRILVRFGNREEWYFCSFSDAVTTYYRLSKYKTVVYGTHYSGGWEVHDGRATPGEHLYVTW
jgi:hypothetical protein